METSEKKPVIRVKSALLMYKKYFGGVHSRGLEDLMRARPPLFTYSEVWGSFGHGKRWFDYTKHERECELLEKVLTRIKVSIVRTPTFHPTPDGWLICGGFDPFNFRVYLPDRKFWIIAHEAAHVLDFLGVMSGLSLGEPKAIVQKELMASAAGYLLTCKRLGIYHPRAEVDYAKSYGATSEDLSLVEGRIKWAANKLADLMYDEEKTSSSLAELNVAPV